MNQFVALLFIMKFFLPPNFRDPTNPDCDANKLTNSVQTIVRYLNDPNYFYPMNQKQLGTYCEQVTTSTRHIYRFSQKCAGQPARSIFAVFAWSFGRATRRYCGKKARFQNEMFNFAACINPNKARSARCYQKFMRKFSRANTVKDNSRKFPYLCCTIVDLNECTKISLELSGVAACTEQNIRNYFNYVESVGNTVMNSLCSEFEASSQCDSILGLASKNGTKLIEKDPFSIFLNLVEEF